MKKFVLASLLICNSLWATQSLVQTVRSPASPIQETSVPADKAQPSDAGRVAPTASHSTTKSEQTSAPPDDVAASQGEAAGDHAFGMGISLSPALRRSSEVHYGRNSSEVKSNHLDGFSFGLNLLYKPVNWYGVRASAGLDLEATRDVWFVDNLGNTQKFEAPASGVYLAVGYQLWRFYGEAGMQFPLYFQKEWSTFNVETTAGGRVNLGLEIVDGIQLELFYRFHSYELTDKVSVGTDNGIRIFHSSSGIMLKFSGTR